ncbi:uncharacterized protein LOC135383201 [Ornithodoros turicata]|uniref:uncharacterized protein LOC135383201 n=1 Tax=Ornithodoros turicata TaxID=34597 RepID=UPI003139FE4D
MQKETLRLLRRIELVHDTMVSKLELMQEGVSSQLDILLARMSKQPDIIEDDVEPVPFTSLKDFQDFDKSLGQSASKRKALKNKWKRYGGRSAKDATTRILNMLMLDNVAVNYSWEGKKGKSKFKDLWCWAVMREALRENKNFGGASDYEGEQAIKSWLRHASERLYKKNRMGEADSGGHPDSPNSGGH